MLNVVSYRRRERKRSVILSIFSHIDRTGQTHNYEFFFSSVRPFVRFVVLYYISMPAMMMMMMIMMDDPGVSFSSSFCSYIKTPFFILFGWLVVVEQSSPPLHFFFRKMSSTTNVILHTHTHRTAPPFGAGVPHPFLDHIRTPG